MKDFFDSINNFENANEIRTAVELVSDEPKEDLEPDKTMPEAKQEVLEHLEETKTSLGLKSISVLR